MAWDVKRIKIKEKVATGHPAGFTGIWPMAAITEGASESYKSEVPSKPVESKQNEPYSDFIIHKPITMSLDLVLTNPNAGDYNISTYKSKLVEWRDNKSLLKVSTPWSVNDNMAITSLDFNMKKRGKNTVFASVNFQQVKLASIETITVDHVSEEVVQNPYLKQPSRIIEKRNISTDTTVRVPKTWYTFPWSDIEWPSEWPSMAPYRTYKIELDASMSNPQKVTKEDRDGMKWNFYFYTRPKTVTGGSDSILLNAFDYLVGHPSTTIELHYTVFVEHGGYRTKLPKDEKIFAHWTGNPWQGEMSDAYFLIQTVEEKTPTVRITQI